MYEYTTYPDQIDCVWIACDHNGYLATFVTAGLGPIPVEALTSLSICIIDIEAAICQMPKISLAHLHVQMKRPDDFIDMAERGFFVYDWSDIHRTLAESTNTYKLIVTPINPIRFDALPESLAQFVTNLKFNDLTFIESQELDICGQFKCITPSI